MSTDGRPKHWNFRLTVRTCQDEEIWEVREIYYDDVGEVSTFSVDPIAASGSSWLECADELARMVGIIAYPAFDLDTLQWCDHKRRPKT